MMPLGTCPRCSRPYGRCVAIDGTPTKAQDIRLLDVALIGPLMIVASALRGPLPRGVRAALVAIGVATIVYNARNWQRVAAAQTPGVGS